MDAQPRQRRGGPGDLVTREQRRIYEDAMAVIEEATEESAESIRRGDLESLGGRQDRFRHRQPAADGACPEVIRWARAHTHPGRRQPGANASVGVFPNGQTNGQPGGQGAAR
jgi:hypothetical protein